MNQDNKYSRYAAISINEIVEELEYDISVVNNMLLKVKNSMARESLKNYFNNKAINDSINHNHNRTYIVLDYFDYNSNGYDLENTKIYGLFTLSMNTINIEKLTENKRKKIFGGSSFHNIQHINALPTMLIGRLMKNEAVIQQENFFEVAFVLIKEIHNQVNNHAALSFLALDCIPEVYNKVYEKYGFKLIDDTEEYYSCGMNIYRD